MREFPVPGSDWTPLTDSLAQNRLDENSGGFIGLDTTVLLTSGFCWATPGVSSETILERDPD